MNQTEEQQITKICYKYVFDEFTPQGNRVKDIEKKMKTVEDDQDL